MAVTFVQVAASGGQNGSAGSGTLVVPLSSGVTLPIGSLVVVAVAYDTNDGDVPTLSDSQGNTWASSGYAAASESGQVLFYSILTTALVEASGDDFTVSPGAFAMGANARSLEALHFTLTDAPSSYTGDHRGGATQAISGLTAYSTTAYSLFVVGVTINKSTSLWADTPNTGWTKAGEANSEDSPTHAAEERSTLVYYRIEPTGAGPFINVSTLSPSGAYDWALSLGGFEFPAVNSGAGEADAVSATAGAGVQDNAGSGTSAAVSATTALGGFDLPGAGESDALSSTSAYGTPEVDGAGQSDAVSLVVAAPVQEQLGAGQSEALSTATALGGLDVEGAGSSAAVSTTTAAGGFDNPGAGQADAVSTTTAAGGFDNPGAGQADAVSTTAAAAEQTNSGRGLSAAVSTATGAAQVEVRGGARAFAVSATRPRNLPGAYAVIDPAPPFVGGFERPQ